MTAPEGRPEITLHLTRTFQSPREKVFRAWTDPEEITKWWGPEGCSSPSAEIDLRVGGRYRIAMTTPEMGEIYSTGEYREVIPPERLVFTWVWEKVPEMEGVETLMTLEFREKGDSTEIILTHERFPTEKDRDNHEWGWNSCLDCLEKMLV
ncbi:SRPBCC domain-containing protein [Nitrospinota bacterium]